MEIKTQYLERLNELIKRSDSSPAFAAILIKDNTIVATGFAHRSASSDNELLLIHAEEAALLNALRERVGLCGSSIYVLGVRDSGEVRYTEGSYCCLVCSRLLFQTEVVSVYYPTADGWEEKSVGGMFTEAMKRII